MCSPRFVAHEKHGHTDREHRYGQKVLHLPIPEFLYAGIIGGTFDTAVPTSIVVRPVAVVFAICFVVLGVIRDEVVKSETVMARYKINALLSLAFFMTVNCRATKQPVSKVLDRILFAAKKTPNIVSKPSVPLLPTISNEAAYLIEPSRVPSLGDELGPCELGVGFNVPQYGRIGISCPDSSRSRIAADRMKADLASVALTHRAEGSPRDRIGTRRHAFL